MMYSKKMVSHPNDISGGKILILATGIDLFYTSHNGEGAIDW